MHVTIIGLETTLVKGPGGVKKYSANLLKSILFLLKRVLKDISHSWLMEKSVTIDIIGIGIGIAIEEPQWSLGSPDAILETSCNDFMTYDLVVNSVNG